MPFDKNQFEIKRISANSVDFAYIEAGEGPLVLCLHGFPDTAYTYHEILPALAEAGFRAVAPFMRGYVPTGTPANQDYRVISLGQDAVSLIGALGYSSASIIGHDWGAATAYAAANIAPTKVDSIITAAVPHLRTLKPSLAQLRRSWYMMFFQLRFIAETAVKHNDFALIEKLWEDWSPNWNYDEALIQEIKNVLSTQRGLKAALGYYRAMFSNPFNKANKVAAQTIFQKTTVPTLTFAGVNDGCIGVELFDNMDAAIDAPYRFYPVEGAGHFMHLEKPKEFIRETVGFLVGEKVAVEEEE